MFFFIVLFLWIESICFKRLHIAKPIKQNPSSEFLIQAEDTIYNNFWLKDSCLRNALARQVTLHKTQSNTQRCVHLCIFSTNYQPNVITLSKQTICLVHGRTILLCVCVLMCSFCNDAQIRCGTLCISIHMRARRHILGRGHHQNTCDCVWVCVLVAQTHTHIMSPDNRQTNTIRNWCLSLLASRAYRPNNILSNLPTS